MKMRNVPSWLIVISAIGLGFFAFVIASGVFLNLAGPKLGPSTAIILTSLVGLVLAYISFRYSRLFMLKHLRVPFVEGDPLAPEPHSRPSGRIARAIMFAGLIFFPIFIFALLSSIINAYV